MDIICARTGRHFRDTVAARQCAEEHRSCSECVWDKDISKIEHSNINKRSVTDKYLDNILSGLIVNAKKTKPCWDEIKNFLLDDKTDEIIYTDSFVCENFARTLQENATAKGFDCAIAYIGLQELPETGHMCNAFDTSDKGIVYVDCTGNKTGKPKNNDKTVEVIMGKQYIPKFIFPEYGFFLESGSLGTINHIDLIWSLGKEIASNKNSDAEKWYNRKTDYNEMERPLCTLCKKPMQYSIERRTWFCSKLECNSSVSEDNKLVMSNEELKQIYDNNRSKITGRNKQSSLKNQYDKEVSVENKIDYQWVAIIGLAIVVLLIIFFLSR